MREERLAGSRGAETLHADKGAARPEPALPAELRPRPRPRPAAPCRGPRPGIPRAPARTAPSTASRRRPRRYDPAPARRARPSRAKPRSRWRARSPGARRRPRPAHRRRAPSGSPMPASLRSNGSDWRVSASSDGGVAPVQRQGPALGGLDRVGRAIDVEPGHRPQRRQMLDRLMGRPVLAEPDRVVRHDIDDAAPP